MPIKWTDDIFVPYNYGYFAFVYNNKILKNPPLSMDELINSTIIDGSGKLQSTITISTEEDICIEPIILGFTIQDGAGTLVERYYDNPDGGIDALEQYVGGGVLSYLANPTFHYNNFQNNGEKPHCSNSVYATKSDCEENGYTWFYINTKTGSAIYAASDDDLKHAMDLVEESLKEI